MGCKSIPNITESGACEDEEILIQNKNTEQPCCGSHADMSAFQTCRKCPSCHFCTVSSVHVVAAMLPVILLWTRTRIRFGSGPGLAEIRRNLFEPRAARGRQGRWRPGQAALAASESVSLLRRLCHRGISNFKFIVTVTARPASE